jgi:HK97 family phage prohead protease
MPAPQKVSLDEILTKRQGNVKKTHRGDALFKVASKAPRSFDAEARTARFIMTSETVDRYGDIVRQAGMQIDRFLENPQALMFHNSRNWPIGGWSNVTKVLTGRPKRTEGNLDFMEEGADPDADRACTHVGAGTIRAVSIGFMPLNWESITDENDYWTGYDFTESELYECSLVPIPAQPDALAKAAGRDDKLLLCLLEDALDNYEKTPEGLILPKAEYEKLYQTTRTKLAPAPKAAELPVTDEEKEAAALRAVEFEVAKLCPPTEGAVAAVEGEIKAKLAVVDGKWKHAGDVAAGDKVNYVLETKVADDKTVYSLAHKYAPALVRGENGWAAPITQNLIEGGGDLDNPALGGLLNIVVERSLCRSSSAQPKEQPPEISLSAMPAVASDEEAEKLVGLLVAFDANNEANKACSLASMVLEQKLVGEVIASYIVDHGEKKGAHGLAVEFLSPDGKGFSGMFRGIEASRFKLVTAKAQSKVGELVIELDATEAVAEMESLVTKFEVFRERILGIFKIKAPAAQERIEPKFDAPKPPSESEIAVARARATAARQRAAEVLA